MRTIIFGAKQTRMILCAEKEAVVYGWPELNEQARFPLPGAFREIRLDPSEKRLYIAAA